MAKYGQIKVTKRLNDLLKSNPTRAQQMFDHAFKIIDFYDDQTEKALKEKTEPAAIVAGFYEVLDDAVNNRILAKHEVSCRKGCSHCCHQRVDMNVAEAQLILDWTHEKDMEVNWEKAELQKDWEIQDYTKVGREAAACIFLKDNECSIYPVRPSACRRYFVVTPAYLCDFFTFPKYEVACPADIEVEAVATAIAHIDEALLSLPAAILKAGDTEAPE